MEIYFFIGNRPSKDETSKVKSRNYISCNVSQTIEYVHWLQKGFSAKNEGAWKYFLQAPLIYFFKLTRDRCTNRRTGKRTSILWINFCLSLNHRDLHVRGNIIEVVGKYRDKLTWFIYSQSYLLPLMPDSLN